MAIRYFFPQDSFTSGSELTAMHMNPVTLVGPAPTSFFIDTVSSVNVLRLRGINSTDGNLNYTIKIVRNVQPEGSEIFVHFTVMASPSQSTFGLILSSDSAGGNRAATHANNLFLLRPDAIYVSGTSYPTISNYPANITVRLTRSGNTYTNVDVLVNSQPTPMISKSVSIPVSTALTFAAISYTTSFSTPIVYIRDFCIYDNTGDYANEYMGELKTLHLPYAAEVPGNQSIPDSIVGRLGVVNYRGVGAPYNNVQIRTGQDKFTLDTSQIDPTWKILAMRNMLRNTSIDITQYVQQIVKANDDSWDNSRWITQNTKEAWPTYIHDAIMGVNPENPALFDQYRQITKADLDKAEIGYLANG